MWTSRTILLGIMVEMAAVGVLMAAAVLACILASRC